MTILLDVPSSQEIIIIIWTNEIYPFEGSVLKLSSFFVGEQTFIYTIILLTSLWTSLEPCIASSWETMVGTFYTSLISVLLR